MADMPSMAARQVIAEAVRQMREQAGLGSTELAEIAGLARSAISQIELGHSGVSAETLERIADACGRTYVPTFPSKAQTDDALASATVMVRAAQRRAEEAEAREAAALAKLETLLSQMEGLVHLARSKA